MVITYTGENYQPSRIFYKCSDKELLHRKLKGLRCMDYAEEYDLWQWLFMDEAKRIDLKTSYNDVPRSVRPVALGNFYIREDEVILDVHSYDRVIAALKFFTKHISTEILMPSEVAFVNRIFSDEDVEPRDAELINHDKYFANTYNTEDAVEEALKKAKDLGNPEMLIPLLDEARQQPIEWIERLPLHFEDEGVASIEHTLLSRTVVAHKRWEGEEDYSTIDLFKEMLSSPKFLENLELDDEMLEALESDDSNE